MMEILHLLIFSESIFDPCSTLHFSSSTGENYRNFFPRHLASLLRLVGLDESLNFFFSFLLSLSQSTRKHYSSEQLARMDQSVLGSKFWMKGRKKSKQI